MKIIKIEKNNNDLVITLDATYSISKIYIDTLLNIDNLSSSDDLKHTKAFIGSSNSVFTIDITGLDDTVYIVTIKNEVDYADYFYVDNEQLYEAKLKLLYSYCSTCLNAQQLHAISLCNFYSELLSTAINLNKTYDAVKIYTNFNILLKHNCPSGIKDNCVICANGCCAL